MLKDKGVEILAKPEDEPVWQEKAMGVWPQFYDKVGGKKIGEFKSLDSYIFSAQMQYLF